jgi:hypothetical protein
MQGSLQMPISYHLSLQVRITDIRYLQDVTVTTTGSG